MKYKYEYPLIVRPKKRLVIGVIENKELAKRIVEKLNAVK